MNWKEKLMKPFDLYEVSKIRPYLMGIAALWVTLYHCKYLNLFNSSFLTNTRLLGIFTRIEASGNCGVDLFFFLFGQKTNLAIGCAFANFVDDFEQVTCADANHAINFDIGGNHGLCGNVEVGRRQKNFSALGNDFDARKNRCLRFDGGAFNDGFQRVE